MIAYNQPSQKTLKGKFRSIPSFLTDKKKDIGATNPNLDAETVASFGEEWEKFHGFEQADIDNLGAQYFDIVTTEMLNKTSLVLDIGCGSGRWTKYIHKKAKWVAALDPSKAILAADELLEGVENVSLCQAEIDNLPFADESFDFVFCIGVLHHLPNTAAGMQQCVAKVKKGAWFLTYIYYDLDNRGLLFRTLFNVSTAIRKVICRLPKVLKKFVCDLIAAFVYYPFVVLHRLLGVLGVAKKTRDKLPLSFYADQSFYVMRNDALDRFGTPLEQRFSRAAITEMMENAGLSDLRFSENTPYWHVVGRKV